MKEKIQNIVIDVNVGELLEQIETEYLLCELSKRSLIYLDITTLIRDTIDKDELNILKKEILEIIKFKEGK
ncbi:hypothetical protein C3I07_03285 [Campylobacter jejuni]|uniref:hypothetical protein n=1 Tax=Campylobacter jejuni TaxID=197 RepID=UPI000F80C037|nr:hypothetical protein [Campylobacter jejuni]RTI74988.1 hypothetical protein C3I12_03935 [Campylobacter jejuni]RTI83912.1 hypothetical protein C3I10_03360 [Campylobacter jejuni]RTI88017.1 hypothetical protein C3I07_03285 [Campylobacter jejuni]RTJ16154.1 hypothetical protein C3H85_02265 [Campylobacter jejuni]RTJ43960.1 hypothetical protein C3H73_01130 [Campylobacter jejuni]